MPAINSPSNPNNFPINPGPTNQPSYVHGVDSRRSFIPMAFQITSPLDSTKALLPHALVMHVNPQSFAESYTKKIERIQTRGGFVEQHWGDEMTDLSADGVTGAFLNIYTGTASVTRQYTIAWDRYRDLYDLYRNNGSVFDPYGNIVLQGNVMLMYDRGTYIGYFRTFEVEETDDTPFMFKVSWSFKVQQAITLIPTGQGVSPNGYIGTPAFQSANFQVTPPPNQTTQQVAAATQSQAAGTAIGNITSGAVASESSSIGAAVGSGQAYYTPSEQAVITAFKNGT